MNKSLQFFTNSEILAQIGPARLARFFEPFEDRFQVGLGLPAQPTISDYSAVSAILADTENRTEQLRHAMLTLESAASPENCARMDHAIARRIPNVGVNQSCPLDRALELWFAAPEEFPQFTHNGKDAVPCVPDQATFENRPQIAERSTLLGHPTCGGLGKPKPKIENLSPPSDSSYSSDSSDASSTNAPHHNGHQNSAPAADQPIENRKSKIENDDETAFRRLASLTPAQYDRARKEAARSLALVHDAEKDWRGDVFGAQRARGHAGEHVEDGGFPAAFLW
jgi:hypothetical protein